MNPEKKSIFMIGIAGSGMRGLAYLLHAQGNTILGTDEQYDHIHTQADFSEYTLAQEDASEELLSAATVVIYSDAVTKNHPLRVLADKLNIFTQSYQEALGEFASHFTTLAVTGTHGKSSTTAFLAHILIESGLDPTVLVGATVPQWNSRNARAGTSNLFVVEADEYRKHFLTLKPTHAIITTIDFDHPDYYHNITEVEAAYEQFIQQVSEQTAVLDTVHDSHQTIQWPSNLLQVDSSLASEVSLQIPGHHMRENALLAITIAEQLGVSRKTAVAALTTFTGLSRRFEQLGTINSMHVISDYGHHPEEILATITGARELDKTGKLIVFFEAHTIERLTTFGSDFARALSLADSVVICPVFLPKGREGESTEQEVTTVTDLLTKKGIPVSVLSSYDELADSLNQASASFDTCIGFSAGVLDSKLRNIVKTV